MAERKQNSKCLEAFDSYRTVIDEYAVIWQVDTPDGKKNVIEYATREFDKQLYRTTTYWKWQEETAYQKWMSEIVQICVH